MLIKDRILGLRRVPAADLMPNPKNWRKHPGRQADALRGILAEVGWAQALVARETSDGLVLIDGHLRAETAPDAIVPVLVIDVTEAEADKLLASLDPLAAMAETDKDKLDALLRDVQTSSEALASMFTDLAGLEDDYQPVPILKSGFEIAVTCQDETHQRQVYDQLQKLGLTCRVLTY